MHITSQGTMLNDLLGRLGIPGGMLGAQVDQLAGNSIGVLSNLRDAYNETAMGRGTSGLERRMQAGLPPMGCMQPPSCMMPIYQPICGAGFGGQQRIDMAPGAKSGFAGLFDPRRRSAAKLERLLKRSPFARQAFEQAVGGRITSFGKNDGKMTIQRFPRVGTPPSGMGVGPLAGHAVGALAGLHHSILGSAAAAGALPAIGLGLAMNPFAGIASLGMAGLANGMLAGPGGAPFGFGGLSSPMGGGGMGSWKPNSRPGKINNTSRGAEVAHQG